MISPVPHNSVSTRKSPPSILVVDDEPFNLRLLQRILMGKYQVTTAENGQEALDLLERDVFDLVLLDIMMPGLTGLDVLAQIRDTQQIAELPVIFVSALSDTQDVVKGLQLGANDYINKPLDVDTVIARVDTHLQMKQMTDVYRQSIMELESAQRLKDRLFRIASHDLKSPLGNVAMVETLLRQMVKSNPEAVEILDMLKITVRNMNKVIEEFLDMAACQSGGVDIHLEPVAVEAAVTIVIAQYTLTAQEKAITLKRGAVPGVVSADPARLQQVLSNLVSNALKYSPEDTIVTLWSEVRDDRVRIYIADQGPGIPADEHERLFKEFSRLSNLPTGGESSTGLGLWIVKHMIELQNGIVGVDCPSEGGSIFWVELAAE